MRIGELLFLGLCACSAADAVVSSGGASPQHHDVTLTDPAPPMQLRIESCRVDVDACQDLCNAVANANNWVGLVTGCDVSFDGNGTYVSVDVSDFATAGGGL